MTKAIAVKEAVKEAIKETESLEQPLSITSDQLQQILAAAGTAQSQSKTDEFKLLVEAIIESRKPYIDPKAEANEKEFQRTNQELEENKRRAVADAQKNCPHEKGSTGNRSFGESAFWIHRLDSQETIGICSQCNKVISSLNPDDTIFFRKRGDNLPSQAGVRTFLDPIKAMTARLPEEDRKRIKDRLLQGA